jgi:hypothetical protein
MQGVPEWCNQVIQGGAMGVHRIDAVVRSQYPKRMDHLLGIGRGEGGLQRVRKAPICSWAQLKVTAQVYVKREHQQPCRTKDSQSLRNHSLEIRYMLQDADAINTVNGFRLQGD